MRTEKGRQQTEGLRKHKCTFRNIDRKRARGCTSAYRDQKHKKYCNTLHAKGSSGELSTLKYLTKTYTSIMGCGTSNDVVPNDQPTENDKSQFPRSPNLKRGKYRFQDFSILLNKINDLKINQFLLFFSQTFSRYRLSNSFRSSVRRPGNRGEKASTTKTAAPAGTAEPRA